jgi:hypothetical protein
MNFSFYSLSHGPKVERYQVVTRFPDFIAGIIAVARPSLLIRSGPEMKHCTLDGPSPHHKMQDQGNHREYQQQMNQPSRHMKHSEAANPSNQQNNK